MAQVMAIMLIAVSRQLDARQLRLLPSESGALG
jgi:hypothetical protein